MVKHTVSVHFDKGVGNFQPGETVVGKCCINSLEQDATKGIEIQVIGEARIYWTTAHTGVDDSSTNINTDVDQHSNEKYMEYTVFNSAGPFTLKSGLNEFPFKFELPLGLPCTYHGEIGNVKYEFKVVIHRPSLHFAERHKIEFVVQSSCVLDSIPTALHSATTSHDCFVRCLCCKRGPITLSMTIKRSGYAPGEYIEFHSQITNNSTSNIQECILSLQQKATYRAPHRSVEISRETLAVVSRSGIIRAGSTDVWQGNILQIPLNCTPTNLGGFCNIIQVEHVLEFKTKVPVSKPAVELPVIIGKWQNS